MKIFYTDKFLKELKKLPPYARKICRKQEKIFSVNCQDPRLHSKKLKGPEQAYSFRVTRQYRVLFNFINENEVLFVAIGHRKDIYKK